MKKEPPFAPQAVAVAFESGYLTTSISKGLSDCDIFGEIAHRRYHPALKFVSTMVISLRQ